MIVMTQVRIWKNCELSADVDMFCSIDRFFIGRGDWTVTEQREAGLDAVDQLGAYFAKVAEAHNL